MLSIFIAEELERTAKLSQNTLPLQYFCNSKDRNTAAAVISGLIFQLLQAQHKLFDHILPSFKIQKESLFKPSSFQSLWRIFEAMIRDPVLGHTYCILDGLDECDESSLELLLWKFKSLFSNETDMSSTNHLSLIVVSRDRPEIIQDTLSSFPRIQLDLDVDKEVNSDINQFITYKVDELAASPSKPYPPELRARVEQVFHDRARGTFLWVGIVAKSLRKYKPTEVDEALDLFPPGLDDLYARMLLQIDVDKRETAAKILRWVVITIRPLTLTELSAAIDIKASPSFSRDEVIRDQVSHCGYFLVIKEDKVSLIHQSAKDYLLRKTFDSNPELEEFRVKENLANLEIAKRCFNYLQDGALKDGEVDLNGEEGQKDALRLEDFPFLSYAVIHWPKHAKCLARSEDIFSLSHPFYATKSLVRDAWLKTYWAAEFCDGQPDSLTLLHVASFFGILPLVQNLVYTYNWMSRITRPFHIDKRDSFGKTSLIWAATNGHEAVVQLLLEKGADFEAKAAYEWNALMWAAANGHEAVVRLLREKGATVKTKGEDGTALSEAARAGHEAVVQLLLEKGADVEAKALFGRTALSLAANFGHEAVVRLLLQYGADVEAQDDSGRRALYDAASKGHETVVRLLLENGADVEAETTYGWTALIEAARGGHEAVVRLLLEKGANTEAEAGFGRTAIDQAVNEGHEAVVQLLLEHGADVDEDADSE